MRGWTAQCKIADERLDSTVPSDPTAEHVGSTVPRECLLKAMPRALRRVPGLGNGTVSPALGNSLAVTASAPFTQAQGGGGSASKGCGNRSIQGGEGSCRPSLSFSIPEGEQRAGLAQTAYGPNSYILVWRRKPDQLPE